MKIVYCLIDSSRAGGMERSICTKANYLADVAGYDVTIITTDRRNKDNFYNYSPNIRFIDLGINYDELNALPFFSKLIEQLKKRRIHKEKLTQLLLSLKPDISISTYSHELSILCKIKDGSKKIAEIHFSKYYKKIEFERKSKFSLERYFALLADKRKRRFINRYDAFVVLTKEDRLRWKGVKSIEVIPNPLSLCPKQERLNDTKQVISVGRLTYQKGYPYLIEAWTNVARQYPDWQLTIYGSGEDKRMLSSLITRKGLSDVIHIYAPTTNIGDKYSESSIYVMSSLYEGFGLVLTEAMACGLPCISFDCPSGPSEIITHGEDGLLVEYKNTDKLAEALLFLIEDKVLRKEMGENARENVRRFLPERIMPRWVALFEQLTGSSGY